MSASIGRNPDLDHLRTLAILYYVFGGVQALFGCFPLIYVGLGAAMVGGALDQGQRGQGPPPEMGYFFLCFGICICLLLWVWAGLNIAAGRCLSQHQRYNLIFVVACIDCLNMPFGILLGIFTIIALTKPNVKAAFEGESLRDTRLDRFDERDDLETPAAPPPTPPKASDDGRYQP